MYQVLYRKWRPQKFADVVGQNHVTKTLLNELQAGRLSHAYLFTGSRGTGKTTCAKILAKAVNCLHPVNGDPCNECEICRGIDNGSILDVIEIDAASNNGVDNIRDLREEAKFTPVQAKYRVYIIDEVHMLSIGAFNALLKTLEEPPEHVKFILATTEVHKLPATILSRCQRFDFKRIPPDDIAGRLSYIASQEGATIDYDAGILIARIADGALRDSISLLDQCMSRDKNVTQELVGEVAGIAGKGYLYDLSDALKDENTSRALEILDGLHNNSCDMERLCTELINHFRNLMIVKTVRSSRELVVCTDDEYNKMREQAQGFNIESILYAIDALNETLDNLKRGTNRRIEMEMILIKLCSPKLSTDNKALLKRIAVLENAIQSGNFTAVPKEEKAVQEKPEIKAEPKPEPVIPVQRAEIKAEAPKPVEQPEPKIEIKKEPEPVAAQPENASADIPQGAFNQWPEVMKAIQTIDIPLFGVLLKSSAYVKGDIVYIKSENELFERFATLEQHSKAIKEAIFRVTGKRMNFKVYKERKEPDLNRKAVDPLENLLSQINNAGIDLEIK